MVTRKPRVGVDIDGVVYRWEDTVRYLIQAHHGVTVPPSTEWDSVQNFVSPKIWKWLWTAGVKEHGMFRYGSIYKGAREGLVNLAKIADLIVITSRPDIAVQDTMEWLGYQRFPTSEVHVLSKQQTKSSIPCDVYIDDGPHNAEDVLANTDALMLLWARPWNEEYRKQVRSGNLQVVSDWHQVCDAVSLNSFVQTWTMSRDGNAFRDGNPVLLGGGDGRVHG